MKAMYGMMAAAMLAAATACADSIPAARGLIASNSIDRTVSCRYYKAWYIDGCDKAELDAILKRNVEGHRRWLAIAGKDRFQRRRRRNTATRR